MSRAGPKTGTGKKAAGSKSGRVKADKHKSARNKPFGGKPGGSKPVRGKPGGGAAKRNVTGAITDGKGTDRGKVDLRNVDRDEAGMRLDRWFKAHFPGLGFGHLQKLVRSGQIRIDGGRVQTSTRLAAGQSVRVPPLASGDARPRPEVSADASSDRDILTRLVLHEDKHVFVFNKPAGLAVQGGSGVSRHIDGMLEAFIDKKGQKPRLVHRLDRETSGVLVVARTRSAAAALSKSFKNRKTRKYYWAVMRGVPKPAQGKVSSYLARGYGENSDRMIVVDHGTSGAEHAVSHYCVAERAGQRVSWVVMQPVTGRTHQLRVHAADLGHPIIGDPKYFNVENWELPGGLQNRLHLLARRIIIPHPGGGMLDVSAPLPTHMKQTWAVLGFAGDTDVTP